jgi:hypothetical protein
MVASGALSGATMAWHEGAPAWVPLEQLLGGSGAPAGGAAATVARQAVRAAPPSRGDDPDAELRASKDTPVVIVSAGVSLHWRTSNINDARSTLNSVESSIFA